LVEQLAFKVKKRKGENPETTADRSKWIFVNLTLPLSLERRGNCLLHIKVRCSVLYPEMPGGFGLIFAWSFVTKNIILP